MKREAEFILENYGRLIVGAIWCVGGLFDFISGRNPRAPVLLRKLRLEWFFRFLIEPRAKFQRTIFDPLWFFSKIFKYKLINK